jgi:hypothetical protein
MDDVPMGDGDGTRATYCTMDALAHACGGFSLAGRSVVRHVPVVRARMIEMMIRRAAGIKAASRSASSLLVRERSYYALRSIPGSRPRARDEPQYHTHRRTGTAPTF